MTCRPKRAHSPTASSTIEVLALAVGGGASGFHDETGQGPSGGSPAALLTVGLGADVQAAARRTRTRIARRIEAGEEGRGRPLVELARAALLLDAAGVHHDDAVGDRQRLLLVVRDIDHGEAEALLQLADLLAHLAAQLGVEVADSGSSNSST